MNNNDTTPEVDTELTLTAAEEQEFIDMFAALAKELDLTSHSLEVITDDGGEARWQVGSITETAEGNLNVELFDILDGDSDFAELTLASQAITVLRKIHEWHPQYALKARILLSLNPDTDK